MKNLICLSSAALLLTACTSTENRQVYSTADGTRVYGLDEQPQSNVTGTGPLMSPLNDPARVQPGQFTGKEETTDRIGQYPTAPREGTAEELRNERIDEDDESNPPPEIADENSGQTELGTGAGTLGQTGIAPGRPVNAQTILATPDNPSLEPSGNTSSANPPTMSRTPTLAQPLTEGENNEPMQQSIGGSASVETGQQESNPLGEPPATGAAAANLTDPIGPGSIGGVENQSLSDRIRESLTSGRPGTITRLEPSRLQEIDIEAMNGNVTLRGNVRSETERLMIGNRVARLQGVKSVNNQLQVISSTRPEKQDVTSPAARPEVPEP